jgi:hypothetical protein|tara:strand:- start:2505 stop:2981 length:477 start_codon:yes stop_codon:yes gene_type:complete
MSIPVQDIIAQAGQVGMEEDALLQEQFMSEAPQGKFTVDALNRLVKELNVVLEMFGEVYPEFAEDIAVFPQEFVAALSMVRSAAEDAGVGFDLEYAEITDDRDLAILAGKIRKLGKDKTFQKFLEDSTLMPEEEVVVEEVVEEEVPVDDIDAMFAGRV